MSLTITIPRPAPLTIRATTHSIEDRQSHIFPLTSLPYELRENIYIHYLLSLPVQFISTSSIAALSAGNPNFVEKTSHILSSPYDLINISPFFQYDIPIKLLYQHLTFSFCSGTALQKFATLTGTEHVRKVQIVYGCEQYQPANCGREKGVEREVWRKEEGKRDWVYLVLQSFPQVDEVEFAVEEKDRGKAWEECVRGAIREAGRGVKVVISNATRKDT